MRVVFEKSTASQARGTIDRRPVWELGKAGFGMERRARKLPPALPAG